MGLRRLLGAWNLRRLRLVSAHRHLSPPSVQGFDGHPVIANLGHGMLPSHTPEGLGAFLQAVHDHSGGGGARGAAGTAWGASRSA